MKSVIIDHHNRLGDHIMCHGIVREYCKKYDKVGLFTIPKFASFVRFMFRDLPNLEVIEIKTHRDKTLYPIRNLFMFGKSHFNTIKKIWDVDFESGIPSEYQFYAIAGVPFENKWKSFYVERDSKREAILEEKTQLPEHYIFVHDDNRYPIDDARISGDFQKFRVGPGLTDNLFDFRGLIERAEEIHVIDSSFMFLTDCLQYDNPSQKLFVHRYARPNAQWNLPILKKPWTILA